MFETVWSESWPAKNSRAVHFRFETFGRLVLFDICLISTSLLMSSHLDTFFLHSTRNIYCRYTGIISTNFINVINKYIELPKSVIREKVTGTDFLVRLFHF